MKKKNIVFVLKLIVTLGVVRTAIRGMVVIKNSGLVNGGLDDIPVIMVTALAIYGILFYVEKMLLSSKT